ncbi:MAG: hypothetical protein ABI548_06165 [Polyangiaceae bacterium]
MAVRHNAGSWRRRRLQAPLRRRALHNRLESAGSVIVLSLGLFACQAKLDAGDFCAQDAGTSAQTSEDQAIPLPWSTSFENGFCDYSGPAGYCYGTPNASRGIVSSQHHLGRYSAEFTVNSDDPNGHQTRCVRQGILPALGYYSAWYLLPNTVTTTGNWNLWFFQGGDNASAPLHSLLNVTLINGSNGALELIAFSPLGAGLLRAATPIPVPIGSWFQIELFLKRAADNTGEVRLYQNGVQLFDKTNLVTDDSNFGRWFVGNLSTPQATPADSTVYVDDVSISATLNSATQ